MNCLERGRKILEIEAQGIQHVCSLLDEKFSAVVNRLRNCVESGGKIIVTGVGKNIPIAEKIAATFSSTGAPAVVLHPVQALHGDVGIIAANDLMLALSYSGASEELLALLPHVRRRGCPIVALTGVPDSPLANYSEITVAITVPREACPFNLAPTASTTATLAMGDALAMTLLEMRGLKRDDYARLHPGGAIGRTLLLRVSDIMRTGDRMAVLAPGATVKDAVLAMTKAHSGAVMIVDQQKRLLGIFTDGDLRRRLAVSSDILQCGIDDVMTATPLTVKMNQLAIDVLAVFEKRKIDDLPVVDEHGRLAGAIDIQDLPKLKIL